MVWYGNRETGGGGGPTATVIEDFESGTLGNFTTVEGSWATTTTTPIADTTSGYKPAGGGTQGHLGAAEADGNFSEYPVPGVTLTFDWKEGNGPAGNDWRLRWGTDDGTADHYEFMFEKDVDPDEFQVVRQDGSETVLNSVSFTHSTDTHYRLEIVDDGAANPTFDVTLTDVDASSEAFSMTAADASADVRTNGDFCFFAQFNWEIWIDDITVTS